MLQKEKFNLISYSALVEQFSNEQTESYAKPTEDTIATFGMSHEAAGNPKAACFSHKNIVTQLNALSQYHIVVPEPNDLYYSHIPIHVFSERVQIWRVQAAGGTVFIAQNNFSAEDNEEEFKSQFLAELQRAKPTVFGTTPFILERIRQVVLQKIRSLDGLSRTLFQKARESKLENLKQNDEKDHSLYDMVLKDFQQLFGGNLRLIITNYCFDPQMQNFLNELKILLSVRVCQMFGYLETTGPIFLTQYWEQNYGILGEPTDNAEFKLIPLSLQENESQMKNSQTLSVLSGQSVKNDEAGDEQWTTGLLWVRGPSVFCGYFKHE